MRTYKIILVENDEDEQLFMREGFDKAGGFEILAQVDNGEGLMRWLDEHPSTQPDLVLTDLNMPGMNGMDILQAFQSNAQRRKIPVIVTSTSSTRSIMEKCLQAGAALYIVKPDTFIQYETYVHNLRKLIEDKGLVQPAENAT
ncbi:MAG: response regulator [Chitinophagaceae bacterium]|nr:MAG: response regulator [Chitinophagaceae bacterium]